MYDIVIISLILFFDEMVVRFTTIGRPSVSALLLTALFSAAYGLILAAPGQVPKEIRKRNLINIVVLSAVTLFYLVMCFIHLQFKLFYDVPTIVNGAGGVVKHYQRDIWLLIKSTAGFRTIVLLLLPPVQAVIIPYLVHKDRTDKQKTADEVREDSKAPAIPLSQFSFVSGLLLAVTLILTMRALAATRPVYTRHYDYQSAVSSFGLMTAFRMDAVRMVTGAGKSEAFSVATQTPAKPMKQEFYEEDPVVPEKEQEPEKKPEDYPYSMLDIDFEKLKEAGGIYAEIDSYVETLVPSRQNRYTGLFAGKNLIFISGEAFSGYVVDEELTPVLYRMMTKGIQIKEFYQSAGAGTTGGEYQNLFGLLPTAGGASMNRKVNQHNYFTMGWQLDHLGYFGQAFHNGEVGYYGRDVTHERLGYSEGFLAHWNGLEKLMTEDTIYSDREMARATLPLYADKEQFNVYYMTISAHSPYSRYDNYFSNRHWERVEHLDYPDEVKAFIAANLEVEDMLACILAELEEKGIANDTVIVLSPDHFPYGLSYQGLESLYGNAADTNLKRDRNGAVIWCGCLEEMEEIVVETPVTSLDLLPTLLNLFGLPWDSRLLPGRDILSDAEVVAFNAWQDWKTELGTYTVAGSRFEPEEGVSEKDIPEGYVQEMCAKVRNKYLYCQRLTEYDYYYHVFGEDGPWKE